MIRWIALIATLASVAPAAAETVILKNGAFVEGEVTARKTARKTVKKKA